jgi:hypothetical protein
MEKYREVVDEERKRALHSEAEKNIRTGTQLWFCLKAQEPLPKIHWFKSGAHIETHLMVGSWESENIKENKVDFAYFPLIIIRIVKLLIKLKFSFVQNKMESFKN